MLLPLLGLIGATTGLDGGPCACKALRVVEEHGGCSSEGRFGSCREYYTAESHARCIAPDPNKHKWAFVQKKCVRSAEDFCCQGKNSAFGKAQEEVSGFCVCKGLEVVEEASGCSSDSMKGGCNFTGVKGFLKRKCPANSVLQFRNSSGGRDIVELVDKFPEAGQKFRIPSGKKTVEINIGANKSPIKATNSEVFLILVEPSRSIAPELKKKDPCATVLQVAISNFTGTAVFHNYATNSQASSSLSEPVLKNKHLPQYKGEIVYNVSVYTLKELLQAIPEELHISFLKTDMQGYDLVAIKSAGKALRRVHRVFSEIFADGKPRYKGVDNSYTSFTQYMREIGFQASKACHIDGEWGDCEFFRP